MQKRFLDGLKSVVQIDHNTNFIKIDKINLLFSDPDVLLYESEDYQMYEDKLEQVKKAQAKEKIRLKAFDLQKKLKSRNPSPVVTSTRKVQLIPRSRLQLGYSLTPGKDGCCEHLHPEGHHLAGVASGNTKIIIYRGRISCHIFTGLVEAVGQKRLC